MAMGLRYASSSSRPYLIWNKFTSLYIAVHECLRPRLRQSQLWIHEFVYRANVFEIGNECRGFGRRLLR